MLKDVSVIVLDIILKATVLLALAWSVSLLLRKRSAATRHMIKTFTLAGLLLLPCSIAWVPAWHVKGIPSFARTEPIQQPDASSTASATPASRLSATADVAPSARALTDSRQGRLHHAANTLPATTPHQAAPDISPSPAANAASVNISAFPGSPSQRPAALWQRYLGPLLLSVWAAGLLVVLARWGRSYSRVSGVVRRASVLIDSGWNAQVRALAAELNIHRHVALLVSDELEVPMATGVMFPRVVLSPDYAEWSARRRSAILRHELAHIKRWDAFTQTLAHFVAALYWFHPLVWLMVSSMRAERERACDDQVLAAGTKASDYAHELLDIVSGLRGPELAAALAMARRSQLEGRVLAVLDPALPRGQVSRRSALAVAALTLIIMLPVAALRPATQATTEQKPSPAAASTARPDNISSVDAQAAPEARPGESIAAEPAEVPEPPEAAQPPDANGFPPLAPAAPSSAPQPAPPALAPPAPPGPPLGPAAELSVCGARARMQNMSVDSDNGSKHWTVTWSGDDCTVDLRADGEIKFNAEATEVQSISSGGSFSVSIRQGDMLKQVKVTPSAGGLQYVYKVNGQQQPFEGEARTWFSQFLLDLERSTGFSADARVPALLAKGGPNAVLDEIRNLRGDYVRGIYFRKLLEQPNLPGPVVQRVITQAGAEITSDYELARVLMTVGKQYELADEASRTAFLNAAGKLKSDYEHSRVLIELLRRPNISKDLVNVALKSSASISSDYEKSRILLSLMDQKSFEPAQLDFYLKMVDSIHSDYEKSRDLLAPMQRYTLAVDQINRIMSATATISSDYEKSRLLAGLAGKGKFDEGQMSSYLKVVDSMGSDYERSRSLMELMKNNTLSASSVSKALAAVSRENSDYEKSRVINSLVESHKFDETQMSTYLAVVDSMQSDNERSRSLLGLLEHDKLSDASVAKVISEISRMNSDYEKARTLLAVASRYPLTGAARESYIKTAESINSEYERNRALAAVVKRATL
ncbi:MAG TPA: M56 family metallopeptidase [Candidatus Angelobacter sp.]|nr:M56 family metallopeptidase [Candidatus Angelobacter sp.]